MRTKIIKNELSEQFKTWLEFYQYCGGPNLDSLPSDVNNIAIMGMDNSTKYEVDIDFLKARVFDEIRESLPTHEDMQLISAKIFEMNGPIHSKLKKLVIER